MLEALYLGIAAFIGFWIGYSFGVDKSDKGDDKY